jgi:hypothetical protein
VHSALERRDCRDDAPGRGLTGLDSAGVRKCGGWMQDNGEKYTHEEVGRRFPMRTTHSGRV